MQKYIRYIFFLLCWFPLLSYSQTDTIRYVKTDGAYNNDGRSWATAKNNIQDAINDLHDYLEKNNLHSGSVYVAAGTYYPSESTGYGTKGILSTSFKIYDGIHVYGGFNAKTPEATPGKRVLSTRAAWRRKTAGQGEEQTTTVDADAKITEYGDTIMAYDFQSATILEGNHNTSIQTSYTWNDTKKQYDTRLPGNSYHVVWFATNGFYDDSKRPNWADSLTYGASVDGCIIQGGNAGAKTITERDPATMGGGVYMVRKSVLSNCIVRDCSASLRGGGVYMDGGGTVKGCNIYENQTLGLGVVDGYGGGICEDQNGVVKDTWVHNNVARIGGGIAMRYEPAEHPLSDKYDHNLFDPYTSASIINNNTAQTEAGGVLLYKGGVINHCTIVMNDCPGADITIGTSRYGRTGGLYVYGAGLTYNSVIWGNTCAANSDIQYASVSSSSLYSQAPVTRPEVQYTALNNNDITDWSNTYRKQVFSVETKNNVADKDGNYVVFYEPSASSGAKDIAYSPTSWSPMGVSYLKDKGIQVSTLTNVTDFDRKSHVTHDLFHSVFYPVSTLGALRARKENVGYASLAPVDGSSTTAIPTLFVDPNRTTSDDSKAMGATWEYPLGSISEAIYYMKDYKKNNNYTGQTQILVKQGTVSTAGPSSFLDPNLGEEIDLQSAAIRLDNNLLLYGGYPSSLKGTATTGRNPKLYPTRITANIIDDWTYNSVHCIGFINVHDVVVDGFELYYGNAQLTGKSTSYTSRLNAAVGGGVIVANAATAQSDRIDMTGNIIRNCVFANGTAAEGGSGLFVGGIYPKADKTPSNCELQVVNCIFHNNSSIVSGQTKNYQGIITARGRAKVTMDHCTICNNVGYPLETKKETVNGTTYTPTITISNSAFYANTTEALTSRSAITTSNLAALTHGDGSISGSNNLIDNLYKSAPTGFTQALGYSSSDDNTYPKFVNPVRNIGPRENLDDVTLYGGSADYTPMDMNPMVNKAGSAAISYSYDLTATNERTYGGLPDVGAIENATLPASGDVYYVRMPDNGGSDSNKGTSWSTAFASLKKALSVAKYGNQIWIAAGTYKESATVTMVNGVSVYGGFKKYGNPGKVDGERDISNLKTDFQTILDGNSNKRVVYGTKITTATTWEGLTIQNGSLTTAGLGAGAYMQGAGITIKNCLIRKNNGYASSFDYGGAGLYIEDGKVLDCVIRNNKLRCAQKGSGAGVYMKNATLINCMIVENHTDKDHPGKNVLGAALYISSKSFIYNCTFAYNQAFEGVTAPCVWDNSTRANGNWVPNSSKFYNTIFWGNFGYGSSGENFNMVCRGNWRGAIGVSGYMFNCYHSVPRAKFANEGVTNGVVTDPSVVYNTNNLSSDGDYSTASINKYYELCKAQDLFNESKYNYPTSSSTAKLAYIETDNPYSINPASTLSKYCINMGNETYGTELTQTLGVTEDIVGADRIQDCRIDKGAYEFNGASEIAPEEKTETISYYADATTTTKSTGTVTLATYYVAQNANSKGTANASSVTNTACARKLQQVLDAAGRYKYEHPKAHVVVKLAGTKDANTTYSPTRTTTYEGNELNPRSYSLQIPHGVELSGGWNDEFTKRDPINNATILSGTYNYSTTTATAYHVVTFTDYVFDTDGKPETETATDGTTKYKLLSDKITTYLPDTSTVAKDNLFSRAKLSGVYIKGGDADGLLEEDQRGGACVVPAWATVVNCIIEDNSASGSGGGLYLQSRSLVDGCIIQYNTAKNGGGIAIEEPSDGSSDKTWASMTNCTVTNNTATAAGGGLFFNTNLRSSCNVYWNNNANDQSDVSGVTNIINAQQNILNYPINFSAVTNVRLAGVNNISVSNTSGSGVRWQADSNLPKGITNSDRTYQYYGLQKTSVLTRAGLPYATYRTIERYYPEIDTLDIAGVSRLIQATKATAQDGTTTLVVKNNLNVDIGARAINDAYTLAQSDALFYRLFVVHHDAISTSDAAILQASDDKIYKQIGSSFANPFMRLDDAINYIVDARNNSETARNHRFEIFLAGGTYYPYTDMRGQQGEVRLNTFEVPEGVSIYGGFDVSTSADYYCQETSGTKTITATVNGTSQSVTLIGATTDEIRLARKRYDMNKNSLVEPWEMKNQTILSGYSVGADQETKNVYHVITCNEDPTSVGKLMDMYKDDAFTTTTTHNSYEYLTSPDDYECTKSVIHRAIILDGLTIRDGSAMGYEAGVSNSNWFFRGGAIFVSGYPIKQETDTKTNPTDMELAPRNIPMVIADCLFENNNARQGGAIYTDGQMDITGCSFIQNYSKSPDSGDANDEVYTTYSGGGCIATTNRLIVSNTIFANNEAQRGTGTMTIGDGKTADANGFVKPVSKLEDGKSGNDLAGYGGIIWGGIHSHIYLVNCNSVRNKAYAYPSVYNYLPNGYTYDSSYKLVSGGTTQYHYGINSIFWGNVATNTSDTHAKMLMNYGADPSTSNEALYFSAYEDGHGLPATANASKEATDYREADVTSWSQLADLNSIVGKVNHNVILNSDNDATDGPNFISPSTVAGVDGYIASSDWLVSRINSLCDNGWGMIKQKVENGTATFETGSRTVAGTTYTQYGVGAYFDLANYYNMMYGLTLLPIADDKYMRYADDNNEESSRNMLRVSNDPLSNATEDYIDIGVYEYQHSQLYVADGKETDVIWVKEHETTGVESDGSTPEKATSDLQRAIETLLLSRNDHPKTIKIIQGTYQPEYQLDDNNVGFQIHMGPNESLVALKKKIISGHDYKADSLIIEGGYSEELEGVRDPEAYPVRLEMNKNAGASVDNVAHLFYITDAEQWTTAGSGGATGTEIDNTGNITKKSTAQDYALPIIFDGLTFANNYATDNSKGAGAAIYYKEQFHTVNGSKSTTEHLVGRKDIPKLTIRNCIFENNGAKGQNTVPAVRIEQGGGSTLIYNSLFHSGSGNPIECTDTVSIVNCTFARNGGHIKLSGQATGQSSLYNSIIWRDDSVNNYKTQFEGFTTGNVINNSIQNNAVTGITNTDESANNHNVGLTDISTNALGGPNFVDADNAVPSKRDFHINPGVRTFSKANYLLYAKKVLGWMPGVTITTKEKTPQQLTLTADNIKTLLADTAYTKDLSYKSRLYAGGMERGAYEFDNDIQRYVFVDPNKVSGTMTGLSWQNAYGTGMMQRAIDAAFVYSFLTLDVNKTPSAEESASYVFVKGYNNKDAGTESLTLRNGVSLYGSIDPNYLTEPTITSKMSTSEQYQALQTYISDNVRADRPGLLAKSTHRTVIAGLKTQSNTDFSLPVTVSGFEVRNSSKNTSPVIDIADNTYNQLLLSALYVNGNTMAATTSGTMPSVINLRDGLLYNSLIEGNTVSNTTTPIVTLGKNGMMLNCTTVAALNGQSAISGTGLVENSIAYNTADTKASLIQKEVVGSTTNSQILTQTGNPFAPYLNTGNVYTLPTYLTEYTPYHFQLHEQSAALDKGLQTTQNNITNPVSSTVTKPGQGEIPSSYSSAIDYNTDRDILGNPRLLANTVDLGSFETWHIADSQHRYATSKDNRYPHEGSVVYIGKDASLSLGENSTTQLFTTENAFMPSYLYLASGASLYGNGNIIRAAYVATDRTFAKGMQYDLMAFPYALNADNVLTVTGNATNGTITEAKYNGITNVMTYDGEARSAWDYSFQATNSACWKTATSHDFAATDGWLAVLDPPTEETTVRFTAWGAQSGDYPYTENADAKTITLTQYNTTTSTDGSAHFTKEENMGWNLKGLPYLINGYNTSHYDAKTDYDMNVPHVLYTLATNGNYMTSQSWSDGNTMSMGQGYFMQTAIIGDAETVTFLHQDASSVTPAAKPYVIVTDADSLNDVMEVDASDDTKALTYSMGSDGLKWQAFSDNVPEVYLLTNGGLPLQLAGKAPKGVQMAMGFRAAKDGTMTVSLPDADAFNGEQVWLTDKETGTVTDLTNGDYSMNTTAGYHDDRLTLQIGGVRPDGSNNNATDDEPSWTVRGNNGTLIIEGIHSGDRIAVHSLAGALIEQGRATDTSYTTHVLASDIYVVSVNGKSKKIGVK